jgi:hypothetical protein
LKDEDALSAARQPVEPALAPPASGKLPRDTCAHYLSEMDPLTAAEFADQDFMTALAEQYDTWMR